MSASEAQRPLLIYDGDCRFCKAWVDHWRELTGDDVEYAPYQRVGDRFPEISEEEFERSIQLVLPTGEVLQGARAVYRILRDLPGRGWLAWAYRTVPGFARCSEAVYRAVAGRRELAWRLNRLLWGERVPVPSHVAVRWLLLRGLGVVYLCAFLSLWSQIPGLIGEDGILPAGRYLEAVGRQLGWRGVWHAPTLAWLGHDTPWLEAIAASGVLASVLVILGILSLPALVACWIAWLSLVTVGQEFLAFQWDVLLLEAGFLAILLAPRHLLSRPWSASRGGPTGSSSDASTDQATTELVPGAVVWLYRLLLFRLIFSSGVVKLTSGDPAWRDLTALRHHFETQPLPTPLAWYAHQLPDALLRLSTGAMFLAELAVPFLYFAPRRPRILAAGITVLFQAAIAATGNYAYFNLLTVVLCVPLLDDVLLRRLTPGSLAAIAELLGSGSTDADADADAGSRVPVRPRATPAPRLGWAKATAAVLVVVLGLTQIAGLFVGVGALPPPLPALYRLAAPLHLVNGYGLFAVMTRTRPEIVVEGSRDGETWRPYRFRYKPQDLERPPPWVAPHQPRLDWQMWFAALGGPQRSRWFVPFAARLLQGEPEVLALLEANPFAGEPPRWVRATLYRYRFTEAGGAGHVDEVGEVNPGGGSGATGEAERWWRRERIGRYLPAISLDDLR